MGKSRNILQRSGIYCPGKDILDKHHKNFKKTKKIEGNILIIGMSVILGRQKNTREHRPRCITLGYRGTGFVVCFNRLSVSGLSVGRPKHSLVSGKVKHNLYQ